MRSCTFFLVFIGLSICSCSDAQNEYQEDYNVDLLNELNEPEEKALDALDKIQLSGWHLYSTFPNLEHDCYGTNNSFKITPKQFEDALLYLLNQHYLNIPKEERIELASVASKAQEEYLVRTCGATSEGLILEESAEPPRYGMWIFQSFLNQRDLVIQW